MPIKHFERGTKATAEQRTKISAPIGEEEFQALGRMLEQAAKQSSPNRLSVLELICEDFLKQAGLPEDFRRVVWSLENPGQWSEAPDDWPNEDSRGTKLGSIADATRSDLIGYDSREGFVLVFWWRRQAGKNLRTEGGTSCTAQKTNVSTNLVW